MGRKHCGRRRKCWLPAFSPFAKMLSKGFLYRVVIVWQRVNTLPVSRSLAEKTLLMKTFEDIAGKGEKDDKAAFSVFPMMCSTHPETNVAF